MYLCFNRVPYGYDIFFNQVGDTTFSVEGSGDARHRFARVGTELQWRKKNFRFHVGADLGYHYWTSIGESQHLKQVGNMRFVTEEFENVDKYNVAEGSILAGVSYFFLPRFSVGLEANVSVGVEFSNGRTIQNGAVVRTDSGTLIEVETRLVRLLYLSYHFGKAKK